MKNTDKKQSFALHGSSSSKQGTPFQSALKKHGQISSSKPK